MNPHSFKAPLCYWIGSNSFSIHQQRALRSWCVRYQEAHSLNGTKRHGSAPTTNSSRPTPPFIIFDFIAAKASQRIYSTAVMPDHFPNSHYTFAQDMQRVRTYRDRTHTRTGSQNKVFCLFSSAARH